MLGVLADVGFPMPAAFAFLAISMENMIKNRLFFYFFNFELGNIDQFSKSFR